MRNESVLMKALHLKQPRLFEVVQTPIPVLQPDQTDHILVRTTHVSLCGSDIPFFTGNKRYLTYPLPVGMKSHECVGQVVESSSERFQVGDCVLAIPEGDLGMAEYYIARADKAVGLDEDLFNERDDLCLIQPLSTVLNAVDRLGSVQGKRIAVIGLGSIGLFFCWLLRRRGASHIVGIDPNSHRCHVAQHIGATQTVPMRSIEAVHLSRQEPDQWQPPDICIEAVGHQTDTLNDCFALVGYGGTILGFGVPDQPIYAIDYETFFRKNAQLMSVVTPEWSDYLMKARDLFVSQGHELSVMVTHRMPIAEAGTAFTLYENNDDGIIKVILDGSVWE